MRKTDIAFKLTISAAVIIFLFIATQLSPDYWAEVFQRSQLTPKYQMMAYAIQASFVTIALVILLLRNSIRMQWKNLLGLALILLVCFYILESISWVYVCNFADVSVQSRYVMYGECGANSHVKSLYSPHPYLNYYGTPNYTSNNGLNIHNSLGMRGPEIQMPKPEGDYRIVILGGSTTYSVGVESWRNDFPREVEKYLREYYNYTGIEVINAGLGGWNSWESLINLEFRVVDLNPDMIIIYDGLNDVNARMVNPAYYTGDDTGRRKQWGAKPMPFFLYSMFLRMLTGVTVSGLDIYVDTQTTSQGLDLGFDQKLNGTPSETLEDNKPVYFERNIVSMIAIARSNGMKVMLATFAHSNLMGDYAALPWYERAFDENNNVTKSVGTAYNVPVYDFAADMPMNESYWYDGRHVNEAGSDLQGRLFANFIYSNNLIDNEIKDFKS
jgi:lysophospholipase L1-like esterase